MCLQKELATLWHSINTCSKTYKHANGHNTNIKNNHCPPTLYFLQTQCCMFVQHTFAFCVISQSVLSKNLGRSLGHLGTTHVHIFSEHVTTHSMQKQFCTWHYHLWMGLCCVALSLPLSANPSLFTSFLTMMCKLDQIFVGATTVTSQTFSTATSPAICMPGHKKTVANWHCNEFLQVSCERMHRANERAQVWQVDQPCAEVCVCACVRACVCVRQAMCMVSTACDLRSHAYQKACLHFAEVQHEEGQHITMSGKMGQCNTSLAACQHMHYTNFNTWCRWTQAAVRWIGHHPQVWSAFLWQADHWCTPKRMAPHWRPGLFLGDFA